MADLLVKIIKDRIRRKWPYTNISSMIRLHLMTCVNLMESLNNPDTDLRLYDHSENQQQPGLFTQGSLFQNTEKNYPSSNQSNFFRSEKFIRTTVIGKFLF